MRMKRKNKQDSLSCCRWWSPNIRSPRQRGATIRRNSRNAAADCEIDRESFFIFTTPEKDQHQSAFSSSLRAQQAEEEEAHRSSGNHHHHHESTTSTSRSRCARHAVSSVLLLLLLFFDSFDVVHSQNNVDDVMVLHHVGSAAQAAGGGAADDSQNHDDYNDEDSFTTTTPAPASLANSWEDFIHILQEDRKMIIMSQNNNETNSTDVPSPSPTVAANCTSLTGGPLHVNRYMAARLMDNQGNETAAIALLEQGLSIAYRRATRMTCHQKGSFREVDKIQVAYRTTVDPDAPSTEYLVRFQGSCEGCSANDRLLAYEQEQEQEDLLEYADSPLAGRRQLQTQGQQEPCFCAPPNSALFFRIFDEELDKLMGIPPPVILDSNETVAPTPAPFYPIEILGLVELEGTGLSPDSCNYLASNDNNTTMMMTTEELPFTTLPPKATFNTTVEMRFALNTTTTDGTLTDLQKQDLIRALEEAYHFESSWTAGVCDPWHREITSIEVELGSRIARRRRSLDDESSPHPQQRLRSSGLVGRELADGMVVHDPFAALTSILFHIEFTCYGSECEQAPYLFGAAQEVVLEGTDLFFNGSSNETDSWGEEEEYHDTANAACLCPVEDYARGVSIGGFADSMNVLASELDFVDFVYDVAEIEAVSCPADTDTFSSFVIVDFNLKANASLLGPSFEEVQILQDAFVAAYNLLSRRFCDPYQRRLAQAQVVRTSTIVLGEPLTLEFEATGTCRGCTDANLTLYDTPASFLQNISLVPGGSQRHRIMANALPLPWNDGEASVEEQQNGASRSSHHQVRRMQDVVGTESTVETCYCDVAAIADHGPSEVEVIDSYSSVIAGLTLPTIASVGECKFVTYFQSSVILNFKGNMSLATNDQLLALGQGFVESYNRVTSGDQVCDRKFRRLSEFRVEANITLNEEFLDAGGLGGGGNASGTAADSGRKLQLTKTIFEFRMLQDGQVGFEGALDPFDDNATNATEFDNATIGFPTRAPTFMPTFAVGQDSSFATAAPTFEDSSVNILVYVTGTCRGCESNFGLFDQTSGRRLQTSDGSAEGQTAMDFVASTGSCFCPFDSIHANPSEEAIIEAFAETVDELIAEGIVIFVEEVEAIQEVAVVQCAVDTNGFETTVQLDFMAYFNQINANDLQEVSTVFNRTYNALAQDFCDALFRRSLGIGAIQYEQVSRPNAFGISRVRFTLTINGQCRNCQNNDPLVVAPGESSLSRRQLAEEALCFCDAGTRGVRPPNVPEFDADFGVVWEQARRRMRRSLGTSNILDYRGMGGSWESPAPTIPPTPAPSAEPSPSPSAHPSGWPSSFPSIFPSQFPSAFPTSLPSDVPSREPSKKPSSEPSLSPTTSQPSHVPTAFPSAQPSIPPNASILLKTLSTRTPLKDCEDFNGSAQKDTIQIIADRESRAFLETTDSNDLKRLAELYVATYVAPTWIKKNTGATGPGGLCTLGGFRCGTKQDLNGFSVGAAECDLKGDLFDRMPTSCHINAALDLTQFNTWCMASQYVSGTIPTELGLLRNLVVFNIGNNHLTGTIPTELGSITHIKTGTESFRIHLNAGLKGDIPTELGNIRANRIQMYGLTGVKAPAGGLGTIMCDPVDPTLPTRQTFEIDCRFLPCDCRTQCFN